MCQECSIRKADVSARKADLASLARKLARKRDLTDRDRAMVREAQGHVQTARQFEKDHLDSEHGTRVS